MRRENIENRYRFVLGPAAAALTTEHTPPGDISRPDDLEAGINRLGSDLATERAINQQLREAFTNLDARFAALLSAHNDGMRGLMMTVGQTVRELHIIRRILIIAGATSNEQAERLYDKALPAITELRATMALWRQREGLEIPEFSLEEEDRLLNLLIQNPAGERQHDQPAGETLAEALTEQFHRIREGFDPNLTEERHEREVERDEDQVSGAFLPLPEPEIACHFRPRRCHGMEAARDFPCFAGKVISGQHPSWLRPETPDNPLFFL
ncbi:hypothetical protein [Gemmobacter sp.]|uniref:hypothetical protein n=1 Tax=Gemmobacter sp. TaxID=1898957 RepID=UPI002AFDDE85|nr:hypothetical protein [Gemmobacter sp.]